MGGVLDGQPVNQTITNPAFLFKNADDTSTVRYTLNAPSSGPQLDNVQNTVNVLLDGVGGTQSNPATAYAGVPDNTIFPGDTHNLALIELANKYFGAASAGGHTHDGTDGQGPPIAALQSISASGFAPITGNVILAPSGGVFLDQAGETITISSVDTRSYHFVSSSAYTFVLTDGSQTGYEPLVVFTSASAVSAIVPEHSSVAFPVGVAIDCIQDGSGSVTFYPATSAVNIFSDSGNRMVFGQYVSVQLLQKSQDNWWLIGNLTT